MPTFHEWLGLTNGIHVFIELVIELVVGDTHWTNDLSTTKLQTMSMMKYFPMHHDSPTIWLKVGIMSRHGTLHCQDLWAHSIFS